MVPIKKALDVLIDQLNNNKDNLMKRTKLCLRDIYDTLRKKVKFPIKSFFSKCDQIDLVTFTEEILNRKLHLQ